MLLLAAGGWQWWIDLAAARERERRQAELRARLEAEPGLAVLDWRPAAEGWGVTLLRDPLTPRRGTSG